MNSLGNDVQSIPAGIAPVACDEQRPDQGLVIDPREQRLNSASLCRLLDRLALRRHVLGKLSEHFGAQLDGVPFVERDGCHSGDGVAGQRRELVDYFDSAPVWRTALSATSSFARLGSAAGHEISRYLLLS
jgi:hypothetical protein